MTDPIRQQLADSIRWYLSSRSSTSILSKCDEAMQDALAAHDADKASGEVGR